MVLPQKQTDQRNRMQSPEISPHFSDQSIYYKGAKNLQQGKTVSSINGVGKTGQLHIKE